MNVMRTGFPSKHKRLQNQRKRYLKPFFSGYHTVTSFSPSPSRLNIPLHNESEAESSFRFSPKFLSNDSDEAEDHLIFSSKETSHGDINESKEVLKEKSNNSDFHFSPQDVKDTTEDTTLEFQKLLEPFQKQNSLVQDTSEDNSVKQSEKTILDSIEEKVSDAIYKTPRYSSLDSFDEPNDTTSDLRYDPQYSLSSSAAVERFHSPEPREWLSSPEPRERCTTPESSTRFNTPEPRERFITPESRDRFNAAKPFEPYTTPEPRDRFNTPEPRGRFNTPEPRGRFNTPEPRGRFNTPEPRERFINPESRDRFHAAKPFEPYTTPEPRDRFNTPEPRGRFNTPEPRERFITPESRDRFHAAKPFEPYTTPEPRDRFNTPEPRGRFNTPEPRNRFSTLNSSEPCITPEPRERCITPEPPARFITPEPRKRCITPELRERLNSAEPFERMNSPLPFQRMTEPYENSKYRTPEPSEQFNVLDLPAPHNQASFLRDLNAKNDDDSPLLGTPEEVFRTPLYNKNKHVSPSHTRSSSRSMSSSSGYKTPKSRPKKSPGTSSSTRTTTDSGAFVLAVTEGRGHARGEVGIAAIDPKRPHLVLCQISDSQRYVNSLTKMNVFEFFEVIVPNTFVDGPTPNKLYCDIRTNFPMVLVTSVQRRHFNETLGIDLIKQYCSPESTASVTILLRDKFYALSAAAALIKYVEYSQNVRLAPRSLRVEYQGTEDTMIIDLDTANLLELVMCTNHPETNVNHNLLGVVKYCHTKGGVRLLRANILQPPCSLNKIESRLDSVAELVNNPLLLCSLEAAVANFSSCENLLNLCMYAPQQDGLRAAEYQLRSTLLLKTTLEHLPALRSSLDEAKSDFLREMRENLEDLRYNMILDRILETILENAKTVKGSIAAHLHGCFAIKHGLNSLLDVAKKTYCEVVQKISDHITKLRETHNMPLRISYSANKGFHIQYTIPADRRHMEESDLPKEFILVQKSKTTFSFYTTDLVALDQRSQNVLNEIKLMTNVLLFELLSDIREHIGCLFNLCEYIAELDVVVSFAHVGSGSDYVRPKFGDELNLKGSRHPILDVVHDGDVIPNDAYARKDRNFMILTGPNQSGKSIYIRQMALLQIMAQIGCYVPAKEATFRLTDRIFSRLSLEDSIECNASTLMVEMRDIKYLKENMTSRSLVIIDELCRGTSVEEGTSIAFAICEELLDSKAFIFFTTHYLLLTKLEEMYCNVTNYHFETKFELKELDRTFVEFTHLRKPGVTKAEMYGLHLAELLSFPKDIVLRAKEIAAVLCTERKATKSVRGLLGKYNLAVEFENECDPEEDWMKIDSVIQKYRELYLNLVNSANTEDEESFLSQDDDDDDDEEEETSLAETSSTKETPSTSMENVFKKDEIAHYFIRDKNSTGVTTKNSTKDKTPNGNSKFDLFEKAKQKRLVSTVAGKIQLKYKKLREKGKRLKRSKCSYKINVNTFANKNNVYVYFPIQKI